MSKMFSNKTLLILFAVLLIIAVLIIMKNNSGSESTFKTELIDIDSSAVSQVIIIPKGDKEKEVKLFKDNDGIWKVDIGNGKSAVIEDGKLDNIFTQVLSIKANRLVAKDDSKWKEFGVDSSATRVEFYEGNDKTLDLVIGRFSFQQPRTMNTFVRLTDEDEVYEVEGYLGITFNKKADDFRNNTIISGDMANWTNVDYEYPADSSFQLVKVGDKWTVAGGMEIDSAATVNELRKLSNISGSGFIEDVVMDSLKTPEMTLLISMLDGESVKVDAYKYKDGYVIHSSLNPDAYFDGGKNKLLEKIFVGLKDFQKTQQKK